VRTVKREMKTLHDNDIRLNTIGDIEKLGKDASKSLRNAMEETSDHKRMVLTLALNYSGRWDMTQAARNIATKVQSGQLNPAEINTDTVASNMSTAGMPDPELLIRTSGEHRLSNFLLWQLAYSELYFCNTLWPDFSRENLYKALIDYQSRERRFGQISEQLNNK